MALTSEQLAALRDVGITPEAINEYTQAHALLKSLYADSSVGFDFRKLVKKKYPQALIPELDAVDHAEKTGTALEKKFGEMETSLSKKIDDFLSARDKEREESQVEAFGKRIETLSKERGYTKEGTDKLLTLMKERGIQNPEDAAVIFESQQPKPAAKPKAFSSRMEFVKPGGKDDESFQKLMNDPEQFMQDEMMDALASAKEE